MTLALTHVTIVAVTLYLHRCQAHRSVDMHPALAHFFRAWLYLTTGMSTRQWVAVHRLHHAKCDTADDPHSPQVKGLLNVLLKGALYYSQTASDPAVLSRYGHGAPADWLEDQLYGRYRTVGILAMAAIDVALFGVLDGGAVWLIQMLWIPFWAAGIVNGVGHFWGYRNHDCHDGATNIFPWGVVIGGEELHNNHHAFPTSAKLSIRPYEFDLGWQYLRAMAAVRLVKIKKVAPVWKASDIPSTVPSHEAFVAHRLEILAQYSRSLKRLYTNEKQNLDVAKVKLRAGFWKYLDTMRLRPECKEKLAILQQGHGPLARALAFRDELVQIWTNRQSTREESLAALRDWMTRAETSGIQELSHFVSKLRRLPQP